MEGNEKILVRGPEEDDTILDEVGAELVVEFLRPVFTGINGYFVCFDLFSVFFKRSLGEFVDDCFFFFGFLGGIGFLYSLEEENVGFLVLFANTLSWMEIVIAEGGVARVVPFVMPVAGDGNKIGDEMSSPVVARKVSVSDLHNSNLSLWCFFIYHDLHSSIGVTA